MGKKTLYAAFIGINAYPKRPLYGCVRDAVNMDQFLSEYAKNAGLAYKPQTWLAPHENETDKEIIEEHKKFFKYFTYAEPTFQNLRDLNIGPFAHLKKAKKDDVCVFYYSGHGSSILAPEEFRGKKSDRRNETIVCVDSRNNDPSTRDLIDKELAYLIWQALLGKNGKPKKVHCLVIMDCCHSGHNFRDDEEEKQNIRYRLEEPSGVKVLFEEYLGAKEGFFKPNPQGGMDFAGIPPYVHLAAARDDEKALELYEGGLFTKHLLLTLRAGGTTRSYRNLMSIVTVDVRNRANKQNPIATADDETALDQSWLGLASVPYQPTYAVNCIQGRWILEGGGKMTGLVESGKQAKTLLSITDQGKKHEIEVTEVFSDYAVLKHEQMSAFADPDQLYEAVITQLAAPKLVIGVADSLRQESNLFDKLHEGYTKEPPLFYQIDFEQKEVQYDYLVRYTTDKRFVLTRNNGLIPLFKREEDVSSFLRNIDSIAKWVGATELKNTNVLFTEKDFVFTLKKIEGVNWGVKSLHDLDIPSELVSDKILPEELVLNYINGHKPAFQLSIGIADDSSLKSCELGCLYLQSDFKIQDQLIDGKTKLERGEPPIELGYTRDGKFTHTIRLALDEKYYKYNINEITAVLKIFISDKPLNETLQKYKQNALELDDAKNQIYRNMDDEDRSNTDNLGERTDWTVFTLKIRLVGSKKAQEVTAGENPFTAFSLIAPEGFQAKVFAATGDDLLAKRKQLQSQRGTDDLSKSISPPASLFDQVNVAETPFPAGLNSISDNGVQAMELEVIEQEAKHQHLMLRPNQALTSDNNKEEAFILPLGYDEDLDLYYPIGFTDKNGDVIITQLPKPTSGSLRVDEFITRDAEQTIKFYFKKVFTRKPVNELKLHWRENSSGEWQSISDVNQIKQKLEKNAEAKVVLAIHGITGDSAWLLQGLKKVAAVDKKLNYLLSYDYESIATPIEKTAEIFLRQLHDAGFGKEHQHQLTIVAHSMGGLITRTILEIKQETGFIKHLIMVGTPNAGSEVAQLIPQLATVVAATLQKPGIIAKLAISALFHVLSYIGANPEETLKELKPGSPILKQLKRTEKLPKGLKYSLIAGNVNLILDPDDSNPSLQNRLLKLAHKLVSDHVFNDNNHDLVVALDSMVALPKFNRKQAVQVDSHHIGYFDDDEFLKTLEKLLKTK